MKREKGVVTAFLSLVFVVIFSLILVTLEAAYAATSTAYAAMLLDTAMESVQGEFYRPLFEKYHMFALDTAYGGQTGGEKKLTEELESYTGENVWDYTLEECNVTQVVPFITEDGREFIDQAVQYESKAIIPETITELFKRAEILETRQEETKIYSRKLQLAVELKPLDELRLELMKCIDGIEVSPNRAGGYELQTKFVKMFMTRPLIETSVGIENTMVMNEHKEHYADPIGIIYGMIRPAEKYEELMGRAQSISVRIIGLESKIGTQKTEISAAEQRIKEASERANDEDENVSREAEEVRKEAKKTVEEIKEIISADEKELEDLRAEQSDILDEAKTYYDELDSKAKEFNKLAENTLDSIDDALSVLTKLRSTQERLAPYVEAYGAELEDMFAGAASEAAEQLLDDYADIKAELDFSAVEEGAADYELMQSTLIQDKELLESLDATELLKGCKEGAFAGLSGRIGDFKEKVFTFSYEGLNFDYSKLKKDTSLSKLYGFMSDKFLTVFARGYIMTFLPKDMWSELSNAYILDDLLPSAADSEELEDNIPFSVEAVTQAVAQEDVGELFRMFTEALDWESFKEFGSELLSQGSDRVFLEAYIRDHYKSLADRITSNDTALRYEQEYFIFGNTIDTNNLAAAFFQILILRFLITSVCVMTNPECVDQAKQIAEDVVGGLDMPILIIIITAVILVIWSIEETVVETAGIVRNKAVPFITTSENLKLSIPELVSISLELVDAKASEYPDAGMTLMYEDYLLILRLFRSQKKLAFRGMDLIQENMRYAYGNFLFYNCIVGYTAEMEFSYPTKFISKYPSLFSDSPEGENRVKVAGTVRY